jgi:hypothetical protein
MAYRQTANGENGGDDRGLDAYAIYGAIFGT